MIFELICCIVESMWKTIERPGYFGDKRDQILKDYSQKYGAENEGWRLAWDVNGEGFSRAQMNMLYEDAYFEFMSNNPDICQQLVGFKDVYDDAPSNVESGFDYFRQETDRTHVQDVSIRRVMKRLGLVFQGTELLQIRDHLGTHPLSVTLSPGQIPFHRPDILLVPELVGWWLPGSVESFYQSNKVLQIHD